MIMTAQFRRNAAISFVVLLALVIVGAGTSWSRFNDEDGVDLVAPAAIDSALAQQLTAAAIDATGGGGATPASLRRTVLPPEKWIDPSGPCATNDEPKCALVAIYDYATNQGMHVIMTLTDPPTVVSKEVSPDIVVDLSPDESSRGFVVAERDPGVQAWITDGYRRNYTHQFVPEPVTDPCLKARCVAVDYVTEAPGKKPLKTAIIDLTNDKVVQRSSD